MSYNIDSIDVIRQKGFAVGDAFREFATNYEGDEAPESSVLDPDWKSISDGFWWRGDGSGNSFDLCKEVLATFDGEADLVLTWEGGDSFSGLRLRNHVVTEHEVVMTLGKEKL